MNEKSFEKEYKELNKKYSGRQLHHYQNQPKFTKLEKFWTVFVEWLKIIGSIAGILAMIFMMVVIVLVVKSVEKGCLR